MVIESPLRAETAEGLKRNREYARAAMLDSLGRGESPFASHLLYPQVLDDEDPWDRSRGLWAARKFYPVAQLVAVYDDLGMSAGMDLGVNLANQYGVPVERRSLEGWNRDADPRPAAVPRLLRALLAALDARWPGRTG